MLNNSLNANNNTVNQGSNYENIDDLINSLSQSGIVQNNSGGAAMVNRKLINGGQRATGKSLRNNQKSRNLYAHQNLDQR